MLTAKLLRIVLLPVGLAYKLVELSVIGSRDIYNKIRFSECTVDKNCCIDQQSDLEIGARVLENCFVLNSNVGKYSYIGRNSLVQNTTIGSFCSIANDVCLGLGTHPHHLFSTSPLFYRRENTFGVKLIDDDLEFEEYAPIRIGHDVWIGARAIVMDGVALGTGCIVAANAVVTKDVEPYAIVGGVPAKTIGQRFAKNQADTLLSSNWWELSLSEIQARGPELNSGLKD
jgi:acetyltransferase-like isoleucine patch superfamily enzyme